MFGGRELPAFALALATLVACFLAEPLFTSRVLSPGDVVYVQASFREFHGAGYEPKNRLLMDPVLQFQPWLEFNRAMLRRGRLPLWNDFAGCGAPHLANGQSAVFDPFHLIAYVGTLPDAHAAMAAARLWVAGFGMFLLMRRWGLGTWGRWLAGLSYPFCGFLLVWLLYPVASVAVWLPWLLWATDRVLQQPTARRVGLLALITGCVFLAGHIQTSAHVLIAAAIYGTWWTTLESRLFENCRPFPGGLLGRWMRALEAVRGWPCLPIRLACATPLGHASNAETTPPLKGAEVCDLLSALGPRNRSIRDDHPRARDYARSMSARGRLWRSTIAWSIGVTLGVGIAAIEIVPLAAYLARSPVWRDRESARPSIWRVPSPRFLDSLCTATPYAFGSQRRGHPNLAKALGVNNVNESAGGFAGLPTLLWLAPASFASRRARPIVVLLWGLVGVGFMGAFGMPPVANGLRLLPILNVMDHRRLTLWVAFGLLALAGIGLDGLVIACRGRVWVVAACVWASAAAVAAIVAIAVVWAGPTLRARAHAHYERTAAHTLGADAADYRARAERQVQNALTFVPRYGLRVAGMLGALAGLVFALRRNWLPVNAAGAALVGLVLIDLFGFGYGLNPAIAREDDRPESGVIDYLRREVPGAARVLGVGAELPPNTLMRYGLADVRNYDSVELTQSLRWFDALYEPDSSRTSRRDVSWHGVIRTLDRLRAARVAAIVAASPPPQGAFDRVDHVGSVWIARLEVPRAPAIQSDHGLIRADVRMHRGEPAVLPVTFDPGWVAEADGRPARVAANPDGRLAVQLPNALVQEITLRYDPPEIRVALVVSGVAIAATLLALANFFSRQRAEKSTLWSWNAQRPHVRIEFVISSR
jgi:hypothetical protein